MTDKRELPNTEDPATADPDVAADVVVAATGFQREEWFALLDARGGRLLDAAGASAWLLANTKLGEWWSRSLGVAYARARGAEHELREQRGHFAVSVDRQFAAEVARVYTVLADTADWPFGPRAWPLVLRENSRIQVTFADSSRAELTLLPGVSGGSSVLLRHELLPGRRDAELARDFWRRLLAWVGQRLGDAGALGDAGGRGK